ncbi:HAD family hydrolase [Chitinophaga silvisoli]|uniref:phosphoglycolate phosphatase n=1 Tax=Chitinophaga silvisoli TaxID=2291814 RepID=A0A3E1P2P6_9BACT|nr:HAD family hydrolase [Chitinophaga silvisoli]RFM34466.1 HAD family hydrolase [Chitinophaga silvisoli]
MGGVIFDLDQTIVDSSIAEKFRNTGKWEQVYPLIRDFVLYPGVQGALVYLRQKGIPFAIVTSSPSKYCGKITDHFDIICDNKVCYHDTTRRKPHPDPINLAIQRMGVDPGKILSLGDLPKDIQASKAAGAISVACLWGSFNTAALRASEPHYIVERSEELPDFLKRFF